MALVRFCERYIEEKQTECETKSKLHAGMQELNSLCVGK